MKKYVAIFTIILAVVLTGCNNTEIKEESSKQTEEAVTTQTTTSTTQVTTQTTASSATTSQTTTQTVIETVLEPEDVIPPAEQTDKLDGDRLSFEIKNIYSENEYYDLIISGKKLDSKTKVDIDTTYIKDELYGDFRLELVKDGEIIDSLKINVPRDDRFLILESVTDGLSYGCEILSNKDQYGADEYPDLIQLDFHIITEVEAPQYARYFAIYDDELTEIPIYADGKEVAPFGTHVVMEEAGIMKQVIVVAKDDGSGSHKRLKYEYTFDVKHKRLLRVEE
ncbi:MAG: hypothetical protein E7485_07980 [Ruminococcaceae bacterium]|nr:hypothetical protein [Oscillospiraceae bacterium]